MAVKESNIIITTRNKAKVTDEQLYSHFNRSYDQWRDKGLDSPFLHTSFERFKEVIGPAMVTIAIDTTTNEPVGMRAIACYPKQRYAFDFFLSVAPEYKRQGIATRLMEYEKKILRKRGYRYLKCTTSAEADWSVRWHRKMGYLITGYHLSPIANNAIYSFRLQLAPSFLWGPTLGPITASISLAASRLVTRLCKHPDGRDNFLGRLSRNLLVKLGLKTRLRTQRVRNDVKYDNERCRF